MNPQVRAIVTRSMGFSPCFLEERIMNAFVRAFVTPKNQFRF